MWTMLARKLFLVALICAAALAVVERFKPEPPELLVQADYKRCVMVRNAPLLNGPMLRNDLPLGWKFNDRGIS